MLRDLAEGFHYFLLSSLAWDNEGREQGRGNIALTFRRWFPSRRATFPRMIPGLPSYASTMSTCKHKHTITNPSIQHDPWDCLACVGDVRQQAQAHGRWMWGVGLGEQFETKRIAGASDACSETPGMMRGINASCGIARRADQEENLFCLLTGLIRECSFRIEQTISGASEVTV